MILKLENITLDNEGYDNDSFIEMTIGDSEPVEVSIDEIYSAVSAYIELRKMNAKKDKLLDNN